MSQAAARPTARIDQFFTGPGARADRWRDLVELAEAWSKQSDREDHNHHAARNKRKHAWHAEAIEHERDHKGAENHRQPAPRIYEPNRQRSNPGRIQFGLVRVERERQDIVGHGQQDSQANQHGRKRHLAE